MRGSVGRDSTKHVDHQQDVHIEEQDVQNVGTQQIISSQDAGNQKISMKKTILLKMINKIQLLRNL